MVDKTAPSSQLRLEWVYGYRGHQCRNNLFYTASKEVVFFVAGVGVVQNVRENRQRFFLGHDDDIISLSLHPERTLVATGQVGKKPYICIWDSYNLQTVSILKDGHTHGVAALGFDKTGNRLVSIGLDPKCMLNVWDWKKGKILATSIGSTDRVFDVQFNPYKENEIVTCGVKHMKFWTLCGNNISAKKGIYGKVGEIQTQLCLAFSPEYTYSGTLSGDVYIWKGNNLSSVVQAHGGSLFTMDSCPEGYATGGKDGCLKLWDPDFKEISKVDLTTCQQGYKGLSVRSVCWRGDKILAGTQDGEIFEVSAREKEKPICLVQGHAEGELWGLAVHPKKPIFATASDDHTLRIWSSTDRELLARTTLEHSARSCAFNDDGTQIAVGMDDGSFIVFKTRDLSEIIHIKDRKEVLHEMKYSPDGKYLAVGSNDNFVDFYATSQNFKKAGECAKNSSYITHLDWSEDSKFIQTNSGASERLIFRAPTGKQVTNAEEIRNIRWFSWTGVLGAEASGIWEKYTDVTDVNAADAFIGGEVVVTGDDFGLVKMFRFPSLKKGAKFRKYVGHSAHVTNVRFSHDKRHVITIGGADHAIFQWKYIPEGMADDDDSGVDHGAYVDSNSEDSDSDVSDVGECDSDIETEKQMKYDRAVYKDDYKNIKKAMKSELPAGQKRKAAPNEGLSLSFVFGYRGYDCRNNVFYSQSGAVVYHVAAVGIIYDRDSHSQRFYTQHTDDILCLAVHPLKDVVATGQVGRDPTIHIWDIGSLNTLSILQGGHARGVCAVDFSGDGRRLASVGLDDDHSILVWEWRKGEKLASTRGHKDKIFQIKWSPFDQTKLITVGVKHIKFWTQAGGGFTSKRGTFGNVAKLDSMMCVAFGKDENAVYTGGSNGHVFIWNGNTLARTVKAHEGPLFAMHSLDKGFVTGGKDGIVGLWDESFEKNLKTYGIKRSALTTGSHGTLINENPAVRAIVLGHGHILVGTRNGEILEIDRNGPITILAQGHQENEIWGLAVHPTAHACVTVSDDKSLRIWDLDNNKMASYKELKKAARSVSYAPSGSAIAVGFKDGSFAVYNADTLEEMAGYHHRKEEISDIKFSPDAGKYLAVASHDNFVDIYNVNGNKRTGVCKGASSYITHIDWDKKGKLLMVNSGAKELLFFEAPRGTRQTIRNSDVETMDWASWSGVLGPTCEGIWPPKSDITDVNHSSLTSDKRLLATGDDFGFVKVFEYPVKGKFAKYKKYAGHSAHVTNVKWTADDAYLISTGGADTSVMVWKHVGANEPVMRRGESLDSDTDSEEEGAGYDSDVEREKNMDYSQKIYANPIRETTGVKPNMQEFEEVEKPACSRNAPVPAKVQRKTLSGEGKKRRPAEITGLNLEFIFGYRGFDCRNNLQYINDGADIIFHAAGAGIVQNLASGKQSFYLEHTDDIICLAMNRHPKFKNIVATGQIGKTPSVHVWDTMTKQTLSVIQGFHSKGVCAVNFSCSGKYLLTVGIDSENSIAVWRWQDGSKVASEVGGNARIFSAEFRPDSDSQFVTVGVKHLKFWTVAGGKLVSKRAILNTVDGVDAKMQTMLCIAFGANNLTFTGAMSGDVFVWKENQLSRIVSKAHSGPVFSMYTTLRDGLIVTGGKEKSTSREGGAVKLWDQEMKRCRSFNVDAGPGPVVVKSVCREKGKILAGTKDCDIYEIGEKNGACTALLHSHSEGELWGLAVHPNLERAVTASNDGSMRIWDLQNMKMLQKLNVGAAASAAFSNGDGDLLAVGLRNGEFIVMNSSTLKLVGRKRDRNKAISDVRFSPNNQYLAVGSEENCVDFYDVTQTPLNRVGYCKGISSFVIMMDFSADGNYIRVSTGAYVNSVFEVPSGKPVKDAKIIDKITWLSWTSHCGNEVVGIWPRDCDNADINCAHLSHTGNALAIGDDFGLVKLFKFPCPQKYAEFTHYVGHSAHVTNVRFTHDDKYLVSTGGDDCCVFVWKTS